MEPELKFVDYAVIVVEASELYSATVTQTGLFLLDVVLSAGGAIIVELTDP